MTRTIELPPASEAQAARLAGMRGQSVEDYLSALVVNILAQRAAEEPLDAGPDPLSFWEQEMERRSLEVRREEVV